MQDLDRAVVRRKRQRPQPELEPPNIDEAGTRSKLECNLLLQSQCLILDTLQRHSHSACKAS